MMQSPQPRTSGVTGMRSLANQHQNNYNNNNNSNIKSAPMQPGGVMNMSPNAMRMNAYNNNNNHNNNNMNMNMQMTGMQQPPPPPQQQQPTLNSYGSFMGYGNGFFNPPMNMNNNNNRFFNVYNNPNMGYFGSGFLSRSSSQCGSFYNLGSYSSSNNINNNNNNNFVNSNTNSNVNPNQNASGLSGYGSFYGAMQRSNSFVNGNNNNNNNNNDNNNNNVNGEGLSRGGSLYQFGSMMGGPLAGGGGGSLYGGFPGGGGGYNYNFDTMNQPTIPANCFTLNGRNGGIQNRMAAMQQQQMMMMMQNNGENNNNNNQRRLSQSGAGGVAPEDVVVEGAVTALGRHNSASNLSRKSSSMSGASGKARLGMYFKNKETNNNEVEYKKEGDASIASKNQAAQNDPTLDNPLKTLLFIDTTECPSGSGPVEVDGNTLKVDSAVMRSGNADEDEDVKLDFTKINQINLKTDGEFIESDHIDDIRTYFQNGCNVALLLGDTDGAAAKPTSWFSWNLLKHMMKTVFANKASNAEISMSVILLQEDAVCDLLLDASDKHYQEMKPLVVAESPMFGKVANGMVYVGIEDAGEFIDTLDEALVVAEDYHNKHTTKTRESDEEYGIVQVMVIYKQIRVSSSSDKIDVVVSSLFASGVGDGVIHYSRILDKNPAEPRALFQFVLHRSIHCNAVFTMKLHRELLYLKSNPNAGASGGQQRNGVKSEQEKTMLFLQLLRRFGRIKTRKPNVRSAAAFVKSATAGISKMEDDIKSMEEGKKKGFMLRQLEKQRVMLEDTQALLENPKESVPKTYV